MAYLAKLENGMGMYKVGAPIVSQRGVYHITNIICSCSIIIVFLLVSLLSMRPQESCVCLDRGLGNFFMLFTGCFQRKVLVSEYQLDLIGGPV